MCSLINRVHHGPASDEAVKELLTSLASSTQDLSALQREKQALQRLTEHRTRDTGASQQLWTSLMRPAQADQVSLWGLGPARRIAAVPSKRLMTEDADDAVLRCPPGKGCACRSWAMQLLPASWCSGSQTGSGGPRMHSLQQALQNARESQTMTAMVPSWCVSVCSTAWQGPLHSCKLSWRILPLHSWHAGG